MRFIMKKKRAKAFFQECQRLARKRGQLQRIRRLRTVRKTRFNSRVLVLDSYLANVSLMRKALRSAVFQGTLKASKESAQKKNEIHQKTWLADAPYFRARRALLISGPAASLCRRVACRDFFQVYPIWLETCADILKAVAENDFADVTKHEDRNTLAARFEAVKGILQKRGEAFSTVVHQAAWILDPRALTRRLTPEGAAQYPEERQKALLITMNDFIPLFWPLQDLSKGVPKLAYSSLKQICDQIIVELSIGTVSVLV